MGMHLSPIPLLLVVAVVTSAVTPQPSTGSWGRSTSRPPPPLGDSAVPNGRLNVSDATSYHGNDVFRRSGHVTDGGLKSYVDVSSPLENGILKSFYLFADPPSESETGSTTRVQIWRPNGTSFQLVWQSRVFLNVSSQGLLCSFDVYGDRFKVQSTDYIGWTNEESFSLLSYDVTTNRSLKVRSLLLFVDEAVEYPVVGRAYSFDSIPIMAVFSIAVEIVPAVQRCQLDELYAQQGECFHLAFPTNWKNDTNDRICMYYNQTDVCITSWILQSCNPQLVEGLVNYVHNTMGYFITDPNCLTVLPRPSDPHEPSTARPSGTCTQHVFDGCISNQPEVPETVSMETVAVFCSQATAYQTCLESMGCTESDALYKNYRARLGQVQAYRLFCSPRGMAVFINNYPACRPLTLYNLHHSCVQFPSTWTTASQENICGYFNQMYTCTMNGIPNQCMGAVSSLLQQAYITALPYVVTSPCVLDVVPCSAPPTNGSTTTTTTSSTTTTTTPTTIPLPQPRCPILAIDLVFLLDSSARSDVSAWGKMLKFANSIVEHFYVGENSLRVALVRYSDQPSIAIGLNDFTDKSSLKSAILGVQNVTGGSNLTAALMATRTQVFGTGSTSQKVAIVVTDNAPYDVNVGGLMTQVEAARADNISMFGVGLLIDSRDVVYNVIYQLSYHPLASNAWPATFLFAYDELEGQAQKLAGYACGTSLVATPWTPPSSPSTTTWPHATNSSTATSTTTLPPQSCTKDYLSRCDATKPTVSAGFTIANVPAFRNNATLYDACLGQIICRPTDILYRIYRAAVGLAKAYLYVSSSATVDIDLRSCSLFNISVAQRLCFDTSFPSDWTTAAAYADVCRYFNQMYTCWINALGRRCSQQVVDISTQVYGIVLPYIVEDGSCAIQGGGGVPTPMLPTAHDNADSGGSANATVRSTSTSTTRPTNCPSTTNIDMVFVVDSSTKSDSSAWQKMLAFVNSVIDNFDVGQNAVHVAFVRYSDQPTVVFGLNSAFNKSAIKTSVLAIANAGGSSRLSGALDLMRTDVFASSAVRPNVRKVAVVVTDQIDGVNVDGLATAIANANSAGVRMYSVGILVPGRNLDQDAIYQISRNDYKWQTTFVRGYDELSGKVGQLVGYVNSCS